jgi:hypothetical protein
MKELFAKYGIISVGSDDKNTFTFTKSPFEWCVFVAPNENNIKEYEWGLKINGNNWIIEVFKSSGNILFVLL